MTTILIVDDNSTNRELLVSLLNNSEYCLLEAGNGAEALELVRAERPALVITDILMPVMDGYEFARQVRADPELGGTPIMFYSATYSQQEARALARSAGVTYILTKPAEPQAILNMIAAALGTGLRTLPSRPDTKPLMDPVHVMSSKLAEKMGELGELNHRMAGLVELGLRVTLERDPERLLQLVCDEAREIIGAKYSAIGLLGDDGKTIQHFLTSGMGSEIMQHIGAPPVGKGLLGKLLTGTQPLRIANISADPDSVGFPVGHPPMRSFLGAPIATPAIVYGRIYLTEKIGAEEFSEQDEQMAVALAAQVAVAYENAQLYSEIQRHAAGMQMEIVERKHAENALRQAHERIRRFVDSNVVGIVIADPEGRVIETNDYYLQTIGYTRQEFENGLVDWRAITPPEWLPADEKAIAELRERGTCAPYEKEYMRRDGTRVAVFLSDVMLPGPEEHIAAFVLDITERRQAARALENSEKRFRALVENAPDGIALLGQDGKLQQITPTVRQILGYSIEESVGQDPAALTHPDDLAELLVTLNDLIQNPGKAARAVYRFRHKDGSWRWLESTISNLIAEPGVGAIVFNYRDITGRKQAEEALRASEEKFRQLAETIDEVFWVSDPATDKMIYVSPAYERVWGRTSQSLYDQPRSFIKAVHPDDQERVITALLLQKSGQPFSHEYRILKPDGSLRWVWDRGFPVQDWDGRILRYVGVTQDITERKVAESALQEREARLQAVVENVGGTLWSIDARCRLTMFNSTYADVVRSSQGHETQLGETMPPDWLPRQEREEWKIRYIRALNGETFQEEVAEKLGSEGQLHREYSFDPITDPAGHVIGVTCFGRDINERKHAQERIQRQLKYLSALRLIDLAISSSFDIQVTLDVVLQQIHSQLGVDASAVLLFDAQLQTLEYAASRGFDTDALLGTRLTLGQRYAGQAVRERRTIHISGFIERVGKLASGLDSANEEFADYYAVPLFIKGEVKAVLEIYYRTPLTNEAEWMQFLEMLAGQAAIAIDNAQLFETLQRSNLELEQRVAHRTAELNQLNSELQHANRAKDEFLATMSHELRTPLNSILGLSESLLEETRGPLNERQQEYLKLIQSSGQHLLQLINDVLDLAKIDAGKFDYFPQMVEVETLCRSSLAFVREQAVRKSIQLVYEPDPAVSEIQADVRRLKQILVNLLSNAVKFTLERGQVTLKVHADQDKDLVQFSVFDTGIGIAPEDLKKLFRPFVQVDSSLNRQYEGTGLGLALVQKLADLQGGGIEVESEVGKGSRFTISLPWTKEMETLQQIPAIGSLSAGASKVRESGVTAEVPAAHGVVLLAEDNNANILTVSEYLESYGFEVVVAHDGWETIAKAEETSPDIILMDIQMPSLDGLEATRHLRADPRFAATPIIALTALAMPGDRERCLEAGATAYMSKPVRLKTLVETIRKLSVNHEP